MKKFFKIFFLVLAACQMRALTIDEDATRGIIHDWRIAPLQTGLGHNSFLYLFDGSVDAVLIFTPVGIEQRSGVVSLSGLNGLKSNYGVQAAFLIGGVEANYGVALGLWQLSVRNNYGISLGIINCVKDNYGLSAGFLNARKLLQIQLCGINIADVLHVAVANFAEKSLIDVGLFNAGDAFLQIGILNYHERGLIPWFPLVNFAWNAEAPPDK